MNKVVLLIKKIPGSICCGISVVLIILNALAFGFEPIIKNIKISTVSEIYDTLLAFNSNFVTHLQKYRVLIVAATGIWIICLILKYMYKKKMTVIRHFSLGKDYSEISKEILSEYKIKCVDINELVEDKPNEDYIRNLDKRASELIEISNSKEIGYLGIAHIPFVFRMGFIINDQSRVHVFHRKRSNTARYTELTHGESKYLSFSTVENNKSKKSDELVVSISTSYPITLEEIRRTFGNAKHILEFKLNNLDVDVLTDYEEIEHLAFTAWEEIRRKEKEHNITKLHIVMASSVAFAFFMGKMCSPQIDAKTTVYHYKNGKYPWGICMNEKPENAVIYNEEEI